MLTNLCHFAIVLGGVTLPAHASPLRFTPRLAGEGPVKTLLGYDAPADLPEIPAGSRVVVPRFAAAIGWAKSQGLVPLCVPQEHLGDRGKPGAPELALDSVDDLEPAPEALAYGFPSKALPAPDATGSAYGIEQGFATQIIQRMVQGNFPIIARGVGTFVAVTQGARDLPDGTAELPPLVSDALAVIVPNSGACVRAAKALGVAVLVTGVPDPVTKDVDLYRVA